MSEDGESVPVVPIQAILGPKPHEPEAILQDRPDQILRKALFDRNLFDFEILRLRKDGTSVHIDHG